jgi:hypothetical protein
MSPGSCTVGPVQSAQISSGAITLGKFPFRVFAADGHALRVGCFERNQFRDDGTELSFKINLSLASGGPKIPPSLRGAVNAHLQLCFPILLPPHFHPIIARNGAAFGFSQLPPFIEQIL